MSWFDSIWMEKDWFAHLWRMDFWYAMKRFWLCMLSVADGRASLVLHVLPAIRSSHYTKGEEGRIEKVCITDSRSIYLLRVKVCYIFDHLLLHSNITLSFKHLSTIVVILETHLFGSACSMLQIKLSYWKILPFLCKKFRTLCGTLTAWMWSKITVP